MAMVPLYKPGNPCVADVHGMFVGKSIYVCGRIHENASSFAVNLMTGAQSNDDIALHVNPRFEPQQIVRNTRKGGWGAEERDGHGFPFKKGQLFGIKITCRSDGYEIFANRYQAYTVYKHRLPFNTVTHVGVSGDCEIILVSTDIQRVDVPAYEVKSPSKNLDVPFHNIRDHSVVIVGKPTNPNGRFSINFVNGNGKKIHFHLNPRMEEKQIVRNTFDDSWGQEDRHLDMQFPFVHGAPFQVRVTVHRRQFVVEINGSFAFKFGKRLKSLKSIRSIQFDGDVDVEKVTIY